MDACNATGSHNMCATLPNRAGTIPNIYTYQVHDRSVASNTNHYVFQVAIREWKIYSRYIEMLGDRVQFLYPTRPFVPESTNLWTKPSLKSKLNCSAQTVKISKDVSCLYMSFTSSSNDIRTHVTLSLLKLILSSVSQAIECLLLNIRPSTLISKLNSCITSRLSFHILRHIRQLHRMTFATYTFIQSF